MIEFGSLFSGTVKKGKYYKLCTESEEKEHLIKTAFLFPSGGWVGGVSLNHEALCMCHFKSPLKLVNREGNFNPYSFGTLTSIKFKAERWRFV